VQLFWAARTNRGACQMKDVKGFSRAQGTSKVWQSSMTRHEKFIVLLPILTRQLSASDSPGFPRINRALLGPPPSRSCRARLQEAQGVPIHTKDTDPFLIQPEIICQKIFRWTSCAFEITVSSAMAPMPLLRMDRLHEDLPAKISRTILCLPQLRENFMAETKARCSSVRMASSDSQPCFKESKLAAATRRDRTCTGPETSRRSCRTGELQWESRDAVLPKSRSRARCGSKGMASHPCPKDDIRRPMSSSRSNSRSPRN